MAGNKRRPGVAVNSDASKNGDQVPSLVAVGFAD